MNAEKTGKLIFENRIKMNLTQKQLAEKIGVTDKAICKWENGHGCPDITLLNNLSKVLEIDIQSILKGEMSCNNKSGGNLKRVRFYRCKKCGNFVTSTKDIEISCCGNLLEHLNPVIKKMDLEKKFVPEISEFDNQFSIHFEHPMTKKDFISNVILIQYDRLSVINLFPEQEAQVVVPQIAGVQLYITTNKNQLIEIF